MPRRFKRNTRPKSTIRRRPRRRLKRSTVPRSLVPKVHRFKRDLEETLLLSASTAPEGWTLDGNSRVYRNLAWSLASVGASTDFSALFRQYRIKGARTRLFFSNSQSSGITSSGGFTNTQMLVRMAPNARGDAETLDQAYWNQIQAKKYRLAFNGGTPVDIYMPLHIRNEVESSTGTSVTMMKPKFINTAVSNIAHYGLNLAIERVDGQGFSSGSTVNYQHVKVITTLYFEMRGVE